jgi:hypothetical protein
MPISQRGTLPDQEVLDETRCALAMVQNQDMNVGRLLAKLDELKIADDTIVVYFSDNGPNSWRWNGGMKGRKGTTDEGGIRSVCFMRWSSHIPSGTTVKQIAGAIDLLPTLTSLAGIPHVGTEPLDGQNLEPLLMGAAVDWPDRMLFSTWGGKYSVRTSQYRLDSQGELFDMLKDPLQVKPVTDQLPEVTKKLSRAVGQWREEMGLAATAEDNAKNKKGKANSVDPRPLTVGYVEFPITMLPARDGEPHGQVQRSSNAPNCSYFVNWKSKDDRLVWLLDVHTTGRYDVTIDYTCPVQDAGSTVELQFGSHSLNGKVEPGWDPPLYTNQDTLPRPSGESQMKDFHQLNLGQISLEAGQGPLTLRALEIPGKSVMDVRRVTLTLLDAARPQ